MPANVLLDPEGVPKVADFEIANDSPPTAHLPFPGW
jgi:serine/threonine protein kinase